MASAEESAGEVIARDDVQAEDALAVDVEGVGIHERRERDLVINGQGGVGKTEPEGPLLLSKRRPHGVLDEVHRRRALDSEQEHLGLPEKEELQVHRRSGGRG